MTDKITNYYEKLPKDLKRENKPNKTFKNHHILPTSMIAVLGGTGSGKSNAITDFIHRSNGTWFQIIIFNPVSTDEPLLNMLKHIKYEHVLHVFQRFAYYMLLIVAHLF